MSNVCLTCSVCVQNSQCVCVSGFSGKHCQLVLNACDSNPCVNGGHCVEHQGGRGMFCSCLMGYSGTYCEVSEFITVSMITLLWQSHDLLGRNVIFCIMGN